MAAPQLLARAPIVEAFVDFRVAFAGRLDVEKIQAAQGRLAAEYPTVQERRSVRAEFKADVPRPRITAQSGGLHGYILKGADERHVVQLRLDGCSIHQLPPYVRWEELQERALRVWTAYRTATSPDVMARITVQYMNRLEFPQGVSLRQFVNVLPPRFPGAPAQVSAFLLRMRQVDPQTGIFANISEALEVPRDTDRAAILLNIDVHATSGLSLADDDIIRTLGLLRKTKNDIFFQTITDETVRLYA